MEIAKGLMAALETPLALSALAEGEGQCVEVRARLCELSGGKIEWSGVMVTRLLQRLVTSGLAAGRWEGRRRKCYSITAAGRNALATFRHQWLAVQAVLARLWGLGTDRPEVGPHDAAHDVASRP